jgi:holo-[acyl-carrier protein] synthase
MIFGIGTDVLEVARIERVYAKYGERFIERLLMPAEREQLGRTKRDAGFVQNAWGKPEVVFSERGRRVCEGLGIGEGHVTLTDEAGLVVAVAVLMRRVA